MLKVSGDGLRIKPRSGEAIAEAVPNFDPLVFDVIDGKLQRRVTPRPPRNPRAEGARGRGILLKPRGNPGNGRNA